MKYELITDVPASISEFYEEVVKSEPTGSTISESYEYMDENNVTQTGSRNVPEYADVTYVELKTRPESKSITDLERVITLGKPQAVLDKFAALITAYAPWKYFDLYRGYLKELDKVTTHNDAIETVLDEEGNDITPEPLALPTEPVKPEAPVDLLAPYVNTLRQQAYPELEEFADAFVKHFNGDSSQMQEYVAACQTVKLKYPKGT